MQDIEIIMVLETEKTCPTSSCGDRYLWCIRGNHPQHIEVVAMGELGKTLKEARLFLMVKFSQATAGAGRADSHSLSGKCF